MFEERNKKERLTNMLNFQILPNGDLSVSCTDEGKELIAEQKDHYTFDSLMCELFEETACNGSYIYFNAGDGNPYVGLSAAPCIAEYLTYDDDGNAEIEGDFWYLDDYMTRNELEDWLEGKAVIFTLAR